MNVERFHFIEHLVLEGGRVEIGNALHAALARLQRYDPGVVGPVRVEVVRRMSATEVARLRLQPAAGPWYEVRGDAGRQAV